MISTHCARHTKTTGFGRKKERILRTGGISVLLAVLLVVLPASALYNFEGFPLTTVAQGQVDGQVLQFTLLGLQNSPRTLEFDVPAGSEVQWARTYVGVWGGTPKYTGWVQVAANDHAFDKVTLYGQDDKTPNVWCTGYGVYWTAWDSTPYIQEGHNTVVATTSQGQPENKLDGRIYGITTVVVVRNPQGTDTKYWVMEGNVNLHGEGWTAGANPSLQDSTSATFTVSDLSGNRHANLSVIELTSTRQLPDYVQFNGKDLGSPVTDSENYVAGAYDIADEMSYNNGYFGPDGKTKMGRYWDIEIFDVTGLVKQGDNTVTFLRGKDLNGDGTITSTGEDPEGEDYLHPVFAMLTLEVPHTASSSAAGSVSPSGQTGSASSGSATDLSIGKIEVTDAFNGETATITATLLNHGTRPPSPVEVSFSVDGTVLSSRQVTVDASGVQQVSATWPAISGSHTIKAEVTASGDNNGVNNALTKTVTVGTLPDLMVSVGEPKRPGAITTQQQSPLPAGVALLGIFVGMGAVVLLRQRPGGRDRMQWFSLLVAVLLISPCFTVIAVPVSAVDATSLYLLPVTVMNTGGSDAASFTVTIYLDGEKIATKSYDDGIAAGKEISADVPIHTTPGSHTVKIVADEAAKVRDQDRSNNAAESAYVFA